MTHPTAASYRHRMIGSHIRLPLLNSDYPPSRPDPQRPMSDSQRRTWAAKDIDDLALQCALYSNIEIIMAFQLWARASGFDEFERATKWYDLIEAIKVIKSLM